MIAKCLLPFIKDAEVEIANEYVRRVIPQAEYMSFTNGYTRIYFPSDEIVAEIEYGFLYSFSLIDGKLYDSTLTLPMDKLMKIFDVKSAGNNVKNFIEQLQLF